MFIKILKRSPDDPGGAGATAPAADPLFDKGTPAPAPTPTPPVTAPGPAPTAVIPANWKEALPPEFKDAAYLKNVEDIPTLLKNYENAQKMVGKDKVTIPDKTTTPEAWNEFFDKIGRPALDKYDVELPKDAALDPKFVENIKKTMHAAGVLPAQAKALLAAVDTMNKEVFANDQKTAQAKSSTELMALKTEWGAAYDENLVKAKSALNEFADEPTKEYIRSIGLGADTKFIKFLANVGKSLSEDKLKGNGGTGDGRVSPDQAREKIKEIQGNTKHPYYDKDNAGHIAAKKEMADLYAQAYPTQV